MIQTNYVKRMWRRMLLLKLVFCCLDIGLPITAPRAKNVTSRGREKEREREFRITAKERIVWNGTKK